MSYRGKKLLKILQNAHNYNNFVVNLILKSMDNKYLNILDFGAGYGFFANLLREKTGGTIKNITCVEIDEELSEHCKNLDFFVFNNLCEIENNSYDFIYTLNVLEHIRDDKAVLLELKAKLKKKGKIFIYVPAFRFLYSSFDLKIRHCRRYKKEDLVPFLKDNGFEILNAKYFDSAGFFLAFIYKFINKNDGEINMLSLKIFDKILFPLGRIFDKIIFENYLGKNLIVEAKLKE